MSAVLVVCIILRRRYSWTRVLGDGVIAQQRGRPLAEAGIEEVNRILVVVVLHVRHIVVETHLQLLSAFDHLYGTVRETE